MLAETCILLFFVQQVDATAYARTLLQNFMHFAVITRKPASEMHSTLAMPFIHKNWVACISNHDRESDAWCNRTCVL